MWFLVQVTKGSKHFENESKVGNRVLISDTTEMVISGRANGDNCYRFEARKGNESFVVQEFQGARAASGLDARFISLAKQMGAIIVTDTA